MQLCGEEGLLFQAPKATMPSEYQVTVGVRPTDMLLVPFCVILAQTLPLSCSVSWFIHTPRTPNLHLCALC